MDTLEPRVPLYFLLEFVYLALERLPKTRFAFGRPPCDFLRHLRHVGGQLLALPLLDLTQPLFLLSGEIVLLPRFA